MRSLASALIALFAIAGCTKSTTPAADSKKVSALQAQVERMDKRLKKIERLLGNALNRPPEPDAAATYAVPVHDDDPIVGPKTAQVTIVKGYEYACQFCESVRAQLDILQRDYKGKVRVVYKYFVVHDVAIPAGLAACAANKQGKFEDLSDLIWDKGFKAGDIGAEKLYELAKEAGLQVEAFKNDMKGPVCVNWLKQSQKTLAHFGTRGTPAFYINGRYLSGAQPIENFKKLVDEELAKANKVISGGVSAAEYYNNVVVGKGLKSIKDPDE